MTRAAALHELRIARAFLTTYEKIMTEGGAALLIELDDQDNRVHNALAHVNNAIEILMTDDLQFPERKGA
jgi:hypothetical protein